MKLNAIGVFTSDKNKTIEFYKLLGFKFGEVKPDEDHFEALPIDGSTRLMFDSKNLIKELIGEEPTVSNVSIFAIECGNTDELNEMAKNVKQAGFNVVKEPWDAFWGQRYAVVADPDGHRIDLYSNL